MHVKCIIVSKVVGGSGWSCWWQRDCWCWWSREPEIHAPGMHCSRCVLHICHTICIVLCLVVYCIIIISYLHSAYFSIAFTHFFLVVVPLGWSDVAVLVTGNKLTLPPTPTRLLFSSWLGPYSANQVHSRYPHCLVLYCSNLHTVNWNIFGSRIVSDGQGHLEFIYLEILEYKFRTLVGSLFFCYSKKTGPLWSSQNAPHPEKASIASQNVDECVPYT